MIAFMGAFTIHRKSSGAIANRMHILKIRPAEHLVITLDAAVKLTSIMFSPHLVLHQRDAAIDVDRKEPYRAVRGDHPVLQVILRRLFKENPSVHCATVHRGFIYVHVDDYDPARVHPWIARQLYRKVRGVHVIDGETGELFAKELKCPLRRRLQRRAARQRA